MNEEYNRIEFRNKLRERRAEENGDTYEPIEPISMRAMTDKYGDRRIMVEFDVDVPISDVKQFLSDNINTVRPKSPSKLGDRSLALLEFVCLETPGVSWDERFTIWGERYPEWAYNRPSHMRAQFATVENGFTNVRDGLLRYHDPKRYDRVLEMDMRDRFRVISDYEKDWLERQDSEWVPVPFEENE